MRHVLFVCTGNAARSQMAAALYNYFTHSYTAMSAGTEVIVGKPLPDGVLRIMREIGIDMHGAVRTQITEDLVDVADKIVLITDKSLPTYLPPEKIIRWDVTDPRGLGDEAHRQTRDKIQALVKELIIT